MKKNVKTLKRILCRYEQSLSADVYGGNHSQYLFAGHLFEISTVVHLTLLNRVLQTKKSSVSVLALLSSLVRANPSLVIGLLVKKSSEHDNFLPIYFCEASRIF